MDRQQYEESYHNFRMKYSTDKEIKLLDEAHKLWTNHERSGFENLKELFWRYGDFEYNRGCEETRKMIRNVLDLQEDISDE